jgi:hypothetical protein
MAGKLLAVFFLLGLALFGLIQLMPYGRDHTNPPVLQNAPWKSAEAEAIARRACYDCHSNETSWPWYSRIAPVSWLVMRDVLEGREELNFSEWGREEQEADDMEEVIQDEEMPPRQYLLTHPEARLSAQERQVLIAGLPYFDEDEDDRDDSDRPNSPAKLSAAQATPPAQPGPCQFTAHDGLVIYSRPSAEAQVFSTSGGGLVIPLQVQTEDGWLGFEPGVAQAANTGEFRYRWIPPDTESLTGACRDLPLVWAPPVGVCFLMPMGPTPVRAGPSTEAQVLATLDLNQFAALTGASSDGHWLQVDTEPGNTGMDVQGWIEAGMANANGPCAELPVVE